MEILAERTDFAQDWTNLDVLVSSTLFIEYKEELLMLKQISTSQTPLANA